MKLFLEALMLLETGSFTRFYILEYLRKFINDDIRLLYEDIF